MSQMKAARGPSVTLGLRCVDSLAPTTTVIQMQDEIFEMRLSVDAESLAWLTAQGDVWAVYRPQTEV